MYILVADDSREATLHASLVREIAPMTFLCLLNKQITVTDRSCVVIPLARLPDCETVSTNSITWWQRYSSEPKMMPGNDNQQQAGENAVRRQAGSLPLPKTFDGHAANWKKWCQRFDRYHVASGLAHKSEKEQVSIFLYAMGDCADDILATLSIDEETISFADIKAELNNYFGARQNVVVERARFNKRVQRQSEAIDPFIQDLYKIAEGCNYGTLKEELIRDRIVVGVPDDDLSEQLQSKANLTLQEAVQLSRQAEARKESQPLIRESRSSAARDVDFIKKKPGAHKSHHHRRGHNAPSSHHNPPFHKKCMYCGRDQHAREACPAKSATCRACSKQGHNAMVCRSTKRPNHKTVHQVSDTESEEDLAAHFLGSVDQDFEFDSYWTATLSVDGHPTVFKLDTGASVSVISSKEPWLQGQQLQPSRKILRGPGGSTRPHWAHSQ